MNKILLIIILFFIPICTFAQMSDNQVIEYVKSENAKGSNQQAIGASLVQKGVTKDQLERIKRQVEQEKQSGTSSTASISNESVTRRPEGVIVQNVEINTTEDSVEQNIFGKNIFNRKNISFAPDVNIPTPVGYILGTGDEVAIDIWGASQASIRKIISPEGTINIENLGPVSLSGMSIEDANKFIKQKFASSYAGIDDYNGTSHIKLTLGQIRSIKINIIGEVKAPGTYSLSSLSSIYHAVYLAGGMNNIGSLREINLYRKGKLITTVDVYDFILRGKSDDTRINDGDVIIVPPYKSLVEIGGQVKRPMYYEMTKNETVNDLINYAGGFVGGAYSDKITLARKSGGYDKLFTLDTDKISHFNVSDGDIISIGGGLNLYENRVQIKGRIFRPGYYERGEEIKTVKDLIEKAGGLKEDAFLDRAILTREKDDLSLETLALNLNDILSNKARDIVLRKNDVLYIAANRVETDLGDFSISGMVASPGTYKFAENTTIKDLILKAGGLLSSASTAKVDVSRRIADPSRMTNATVIAETFSFSLEDGLIVNGKDNFVLEPYDQVYIRRSPGYQTQRNVSIQGEILFPGSYTLKAKELRLSQLIKDAGGVSENAYLAGARLVRRQTPEDLIRKRQTLEMVARGGMQDSISKESLDLDIEYPIGIELDKALAKPNSEYDIVLKADDKLFIPEFDNTVTINGAVLFSNTVLYKKGEKLKYYIEQAGGYGDLAQNKKAYIVYMNGTTAKAKGSSKDLIKPGCEIIVPTKPEKPQASLAEKIAIGSSVTSMASVIALLINSLAK